MAMKKSVILIALLLLLLVLSVSLVGCDYITGAALETNNAPLATLPLPRDITPEQAYWASTASSFTVYFIDVRTTQEYAAGHIPGATNIGYNAPDFVEQISQLDKTHIYIVYCLSGARSAMARKAMEELGFQHVANMTDGFNDWAAAGFLIEK